MTRYSITPIAKQDLTEIYEYVASNNLEAAGKLIDRFTVQFEKLSKMPLTGKSRPELIPDCRSVPVGRYIVFYRATSKDVQILRVLHGARNIQEIFDET